MKFLVTTKPNPNAPAPPEQVPALLERTLANIDANLSNGTGDCYYFVAEGESLGIVNADSIEDAWRNAMNNPWLPYVHTGIIALVDARQVMEAYLEKMREIQAAPV